MSAAVPAAAEEAPAFSAAADFRGAEKPTYAEVEAWLKERGLLNPEEGLSEEQVVQHYNMLSKCMFDEAVRVKSRCSFLCHLLPCEAGLAAKQTNIGRMEDLQHHYC